MKRVLYVLESWSADCSAWIMLACSDSLHDLQVRRLEEEMRGSRTRIIFGTVEKE